MKCLLLVSALFSALLVPLSHALAESAVVLTYHRVGENDVPSTNVRIEQFEQQLEYLATNDFNVWPLSKVIDAVKLGTAIPERTVAITFDDAYLSIYTEAFPRLQKLGFPFTIFAATDPVDKGYSRYLSWEQLREMKAAGVEVANHSKRHPYMVRRLLDESDEAYRLRLTTEIEQAQQRLEAELGEQPKLFAYPYGEYSGELEQLVKSLGYAAVAQHSGAINGKSNILALPRFPINEHYSDIQQLAVKLKSLPLPIKALSTAEPIWLGDEAPRLEITLAAGTKGISELACYASGQGRMEIEWLDRSAGNFAIQAAKPLRVGRHRYTCTAPNSERRYQWFSHLWIVNPSQPN